MNDTGIHVTMWDFLAFVEEHVFSDWICVPLMTCV